MERLLKLQFIGFALFVLVALSGCKTGDSIMKCPELSSAKKIHETLWAKNHRQTTTGAVAQTKSEEPKKSLAGTLLADAGKDVVPMQIKIPSLFTRKIDADQQDEMNKVLGAYSNNRISIERNEKGKLYLQAKSAKDFLTLTKNVSKELSPRGYYERRYGENGGDNSDRLAMVGGTLGIVSFIFSFIPFLDLIAIPLAIVAVVLSGLGLRSHRWHMAVIGLVLGILALFIAFLFILTWFARFFWWF